LDDAAKVWVATSDDVPGLATEAETMEEPSKKTRGDDSRILTENGYLDAGEISYEALARKFSVTQATAVS